MNIHKALSRLNWRFRNESVVVNKSKITITQDDINSVEFVEQWISNEKNLLLTHNILFAKLYAYCLFHEIGFYSDPKFANIKLQDELKKDISYHYERIADQLKRMNITELMKSMGMETDWEKNFAVSISGTETGKQFIENEKSIVDKNSDALKKSILSDNREAVYKALNNQITECLNKYSKLS